MDDIAHNLGMLCRFAGGVKSFYSVAEHSLNVSALCEARGEDPLAGLFHDAAEAYCVDVPSPLKALIPGYHEIETRLQHAIFKKFGVAQTPPLPGTIPLGVKRADIDCLNIEGSELTPNSWALRAVLGPEIEVVKIRCLTPIQARVAFLGRLHDLRYTARTRETMG